MTCPLEAKIAAALTRAGLDFTRPEREVGDPTTLDFFVPTFDLYIEVKQFHTPRIAAQLERVPPNASALVLVGPKSVEAFEALAGAIAESRECSQAAKAAVSKTANAGSSPASPAKFVRAMP